MLDRAVGRDNAPTFLERFSKCFHDVKSLNGMIFVKRYFDVIDFLLCYR